MFFGWLSVKGAGQSSVYVRVELLKAKENNTSRKVSANLGGAS